MLLLVLLFYCCSCRSIVQSSLLSRPILTTRGRTQTCFEIGLSTSNEWFSTVCTGLLRPRFMTPSILNSSPASVSLSCTALHHTSTAAMRQYEGMKFLSHPTCRRGWPPGWIFSKMLPNLNLQSP